MRNSSSMPKVEFRGDSVETIAIVLMSCIDEMMRLIVVVDGWGSSYDM